MRIWGQLCWNSEDDSSNNKNSILYNNNNNNIKRKNEKKKEKWLWKRIVSVHFGNDKLFWLLNKIFKSYLLVGVGL